MTLNSVIDKDEKKFRRRNDDLIKKAENFRKQAFFDITSGIECNAFLKKHNIENTDELIDFVQQLPADSFPETRKFDPISVKILLSIFAVLLSLLVAACVENVWIEKSVPALTSVFAAAAAGLLIFAAFECRMFLLHKRRKTGMQRMVQVMAICSVSLLSGLLVWNLQIDVSAFTADTFHTLAVVLRLLIFFILSAILLRISRFPAVGRTVGGFMKKSALWQTGSACIATVRLYPFREEIFVLCNHSRLIQILNRAQEKKTRREAISSRPVRIVTPMIQPVWSETQPPTKPKKPAASAIQEEGMKELRELYKFKENQRASLAESSGALMSTFVLRHKGRRILWALIEHSRMPVVFILKDDTDRNQLAEEVITSMALFNPPEIIDQIINDPLHKALYFTGYESTVSVINDINQLWKMIHVSMKNAADRQIVQGQPVDEINMALYEQDEDSEGFVRWKIVHFLEPQMSVRINDLQVAEDGWQYGFIPVFYFSEEEWNEDNDITEYLNNCADIAVYSVTDTAITNLNEEE